MKKVLKVLFMCMALVVVYSIITTTQGELKVKSNCESTTVNASASTERCKMDYSILATRPGKPDKHSQGKPCYMTFAVFTNKTADKDTLVSIIEDIKKVENYPRSYMRGFMIQFFDRSDMTKVYDISPWTEEISKSYFATYAYNQHSRHNQLEVHWTDLNDADKYEKYIEYDL